MEPSKPEKFDNVLRTVVVATAEQLAHAIAVRTICYVEEKGYAYSQEFDGNDYCSTHIVMYAGEEPIGTSRIRWFSDFAKIEKTSFRPAYRNIRTLRRYGTFVFGHVAQKGYSKLITVAGEEYATLWERFMGFERRPGRAMRKPGDDKVFYELVKSLETPPDAIRMDTPGPILHRQEGHWSDPALFG